MMALHCMSYLLAQWRLGCEVSDTGTLTRQTVTNAAGSSAPIM